MVQNHKCKEVEPGRHPCVFDTDTTVMIDAHQTRAMSTTTDVSPAPVVVLTERQARANFDRAFQNLYTLSGEVVTLYRQRDSVDGPASGRDPRLDATPPHVVDDTLKAHKACFDTTPPDVHVDCVLELYAKVRSFLHRGYQCDSWLTNGPVSFYYGVSEADAGQRVLHLDCVSLMLESLRRSDTQYSAKATVLRIRFSYLLYNVFAAALAYANVVEKETNVRGVSPSVTIESDLAVLASLTSEILADVPKPAAPAAPAAGPSMGASPLAALASFFPGGMGDVVNSLLSTLPDITRTVTETVARSTGTEITAKDQETIDATMGNITDLLRNPDGMRSMMSELSQGSGGISRFVERLLNRPAAASAAPAPPALDAPPAVKPDGPPLD